jgi:pimeloyl-ACP methyl ester carboxylesterase
MNKKQVSSYKFKVESVRYPLLLSMISAVLVFLAGCFSLDPFLFSGKPLAEYTFDAYTGERECADALDTVKALETAGLAPKVTDSCIRQYTLPSGNGEIAVVLLSQKTPPFSSSDTVIVFFRGTGPHIDFYWPRTRMLYATGYPVVILDYRGFGASAGTATEATISEDGRAVMAFIHDTLGDPKQVVYAYSLGSLVGCDVLANDNYPQVISLILEAPIGSIQTIVENGSFLDLPGPYLTTYSGNNAERIKSIHIPLLWIHGTLDETNDRETQGLPIWNNFSGEGYYVKSIGATHTTNPQYIGYWRYIQALKVFIQGTSDTWLPALFPGDPWATWGKK